MTKKQKPSEIFDVSLMSTYFSYLGKQSGKNMTPEQRKERARKAAQTRWDKKRQVEQQEIKLIHSDK